MHKNADTHKKNKMINVQMQQFKRKKKSKQTKTYCNFVHQNSQGNHIFHHNADNFQYMSYHYNEIHQESNAFSLKQVCNKIKIEKANNNKKSSVKCI